MKYGKSYKLLFAALIITVTALMVGCFGEREYNKEDMDFVLVIKEDPTLTVDGKFEKTRGICTVTLKKYPRCLKHEVRHCVEGYFHGSMQSGEDCY